MPSPILARADALMQRRRQGETGPLDDLPVLTDTVEMEEDIPLLSNEPSKQQQASEQHQLDALAEELAQRIYQRIAAELPTLIEATISEYLAEQATDKSATPRR